ncbi:hypothetical protein BASA81_003707 [Batrachochytrium salamandrivorans]|nr:hypothetical protein BASA81_003707 [Batrachochytrium salamandrivorans]
MKSVLLKAKSVTPPSSSSPGFIYTIDFSPKPTKRALLLIDPQNDFIEEWGTLMVPGGMKDAQTLAKAISDSPHSISQIFTTMDTHQRLHVAHPLFWTNGLTNPSPFSQISLAQVQSGMWKASLPEFQSWAVGYVAELERQGRFQLTIWPEHCLVGTKGHAVVDCLASAMHEWEAKTLSSTSFLFKGNNALTEHYSCFKAEVPKMDDQNTLFNLSFIRELDRYEEIVVAGQALSHCVNFSVRDLASAVSSPTKIIVLTDGSSPIPA